MGDLLKYAFGQKRCRTTCRVLFGISMVAWPVAAFSQEGADFNPAPVRSGPVIVDTSRPAVPGASEVVDDLSSSVASFRFQRGTVNGLVYSLFPDGRIRIRPDHSQSRDVMTLTCETAVSCVAAKNGRQIFVEPASRAGPPSLVSSPTDEDLARYLAKWVLQGTGPEPEPEPAPEQTNAEPTLDAPLSETITTKDRVSQDIEATQSVKIEDVSGPVPVDGGTVKEAQSSSNAVTEEPDNALNLNAETLDVPPRNVVPKPPIESSTCVPSVRTSAFCTDIRPPRPMRTPASNNVEASASDVVAPPVQPERLSFSERFKLECSITGSTSLEFYDANSNTSQPGKPRLNLGCGFHLSENLTGRVSVAHYFKSQDQQDWDPDFTYAFYYKVNDQITLSYSSYSARFDDLNGGVLQEIFNGSWSASYKLPRLELPNDRYIACSAGIGLPNPLVRSGSLTCGYAVTDNFRLDGTAYFYLPDQQGDYSPDYSYTASYRINQNWTVRYSNYSNNRWPWNKGETASSGFRAGSLSVSYSFQF